MPSEIDIEEAIGSLRQSDKIQLLSGVDFWHTANIPRLSIPQLRMSDGPNGVRGTKFFNSVPAACLPCGTGLAATWDTQLIEEAGHLIAEECKAKGVHIWLGPTANIQRSPLGGRGFESFSEDPVLSGKIAAAMIKGVQAGGVASAMKHFVANDMEHQRTAVNCIISQRALREIYLLPFQIAVRDHPPWALMTSYNKVNGTHMCENKDLLQDVVRDEWNWEGAFVSDWYGTYSTSEAVIAGLDIEMPGPSQWRGEILSKALSVSKITQKQLDARVRNILKLLNRVQAAGIPERAPEQTRDTQETRDRLRQLAASGLVLLKNEGGVLPLKRDQKIAVIGPNAKVARYCGGGSAFLRPCSITSIYDSIRSMVPDAKFAQGCEVYNALPLMGDLLKTENGQKGYFTFTIFTDPPTHAERTAIEVLEINHSYVVLYDYQHPMVPSNNLLYATITGDLVVEMSADYILGLTVAGTAKLYIDDCLVVDNEESQTIGESFFGSGTVEETGQLYLEANKTYKLRVEFGSAPTSKTSHAGAPVFGAGGVRVGCARVCDEDAEIQAAVDLAREVDCVVLCCGLNSDFEAEGFDRTTMALPGAQAKLIKLVSEANSNVVLVTQSGTPVEAPWDSVSAALHSWYGGNEGSQVIADVLFGKINPSGKLPFSWPHRTEDNPAFLNHRSDEGRCIYGEDIFVGYRFYERTRRQVQWPFGYGLSYATFAIQNVQVNCSDDKNILNRVLDVSFEVTNTSCQMGGSEVVQVYVQAPSLSRVSRPIKELKGFQKVYLAAGETRFVCVSMPLKYTTSFWSELENAWVMEAGSYTVLVGTSSHDTPLTQDFLVGSSATWKGI
ncbi:glycoside hydrolase superfamily [Penicillium odoratum]|uniref:glycoside hydrolase superfamily n=1 Tax=Penicillium odoratum TaxID=1167516 RepID=UPI002547BE45|nr:glycoside hydrolase superfamily [Penicillium odoratum]KAJ5759007.1 glycoside hydrolase superfamily [Penicillium odoratum]